MNLTEIKSRLATELLDKLKSSIRGYRNASLQITTCWDSKIEAQLRTRLASLESVAASAKEFEASSRGDNHSIEYELHKLADLKAALKKLEEQSG